jgi:Ser/Thr protein kinase RdoA (MazF antagonist)
VGEGISAIDVMSPPTIRIPKISLMKNDLPTGMTNAQFSMLLSLFDIDAKSAAFVGASQNFVYRVNHRGAHRIARISVMRRRTRAEIQGELEWIEFLYAKGLPVCVPQSTASGAKFAEMAIDGRFYLLAVFEEAAGRKAARGDLSVEFCDCVGELIGRMHAAAIEATATGYKVCRGDWSSSRLLTKDMIETKAPIGDKFRGSVSKLMQEISAIPPTSSNHGLLHGDVNMGNIHIHDGRIQIFDFDNAEYGYFLQDLVVMLYDSIYSKVVTQAAPDALTSAIKPLWGAMLKSYHKFNPALTFSASELSDFFLLREAVIYVHYHRIIPPDRWSDPFILGMRRHVEERDHPLNFKRLVE